jgi:hypothetical protein
VNAQTVPIIQEQLKNGSRQVLMTDENIRLYQALQMQLQQQQQEMKHID